MGADFPPVEDTDTVSPLHQEQAVDIQMVWSLALSYIRSEINPADFRTWIEPIVPLGYAGRVFTLGVGNPFHRDWVEARLTGILERIISAMLKQEVCVQVRVNNPYYPGEGALPAVRGARAAPTAPAGSAGDMKRSLPGDAGGTGKPGADSPRKAALRRSYGDRRAGIIQPERGLFVTFYLFNNWLPRLGHSALAVILAARSLCYWNPLNGERRDEVSLTMEELARRAAVSVRTLKTVLAMPLVQRYFLRYRVRRVVTSQGVRTAGIELVVRMDDPLTPDDGEDDGQWFPDRYLDESEDDPSGG